MFLRGPQTPQQSCWLWIHPHCVSILDLEAVFKIFVAVRICQGAAGSAAEVGVWDLQVGPFDNW